MVQAGIKAEPFEVWATPRFTLCMLHRDAKPRQRQEGASMEPRAPGWLLKKRAQSERKLTNHKASKSGTSYKDCPAEVHQQPISKSLRRCKQLITNLHSDQPPK